MTAIRIYKNMVKNGIMLSSHDDKIKYKAAIGIVNEDVIELLTSYKAELIELLQSGLIGACEKAESYSPKAWKTIRNKSTGMEWLKANALSHLSLAIDNENLHEIHIWGHIVSSFIKNDKRGVV